VLPAAQLHSCALCSVVKTVQQGLGWIEGGVLRGPRGVSAAMLVCSSAGHAPRAHVSSMLSICGHGKLQLAMTRGNGLGLGF
jgi:hypothetical protein